MGDGDYVSVEQYNARPIYKKKDGDSIIYFNITWKMNYHDNPTAWIYQMPGSEAAVEPPQGQWTTDGYRGGDAYPPPTLTLRTQAERTEFTLQESNASPVLAGE